MKLEIRMMIKYASAIVFIIAGILFNQFNIGTNFDIMGSVGNWLIYVGFVSLAINVLRTMKSPKKKPDERAYYIGAKANRIVFVAIILVAFFIMVIDGIKPITLSYHLFMSYFVCGIVFTYFIAYSILNTIN
ncbi:hypothetical protein JXM83_04320 [Candidatus Woesearchaeota archaeon]|nr:hypothetical protein [Candidatus Woesearchaeota archaeon]